LVAPWLELSAARRANALRAWVKRCSGEMPPAGPILRLLAELPVLRQARWPLGDGELRLYRGGLRWSLPTEAAHEPDRRESSFGVRRAGVYALPGWGGQFRVERVESDGVPLAWLARLELRARTGGERFQAGLGRPPRSLKKQYQDADLPAWERDGPLVYSGGQLVFVPGLGLDARVVGLPGQVLVSLHWQPGGGR
jgi:tRNA(Ile)-lysidine synthase